VSQDDVAVCRVALQTMLALSPGQAERSPSGEIAAVAGGAVGTPAGFAGVCADCCATSAAAVRRRASDSGSVRERMMGE
jgi:hypothetical protein